MSLQQKHIELESTEFSEVVTNRTSETAVYIADLLSELQTIAQIGGLTSLSDDIKLVLVKHLSGESIL